MSYVPENIIEWPFPSNDLKVAACGWKAATPVSSFALLGKVISLRSI